MDTSSSAVKEGILRLHPIEDEMFLSKADFEKKIIINSLRRTPFAVGNVCSDIL